MTSDDIQRQRASLAETLRNANVGRFTDTFADLAQPAIELTERGSSGLSKLGGRPDLPHDLPWPTREKLSLHSTIEPFYTPEERAFLDRAAPLSFIAQIDLAALAPLPDFPNQGLLYLFYDTTFRGRGVDPERQSFRVLWAEAGPFTETAPPEADLHEFPCTPLGAQPFLDPFDTTTRLGGDITTKMYREDAEALAAYDRWTDRTRHPIHKLGGWPNVVQGEMEDHCTLMLQGADPANATEEEWERAFDADLDWRLLFQISGSAPSHMEWDDAGTLYVWILVEDLAKRRFDRTCVIVQSG